VNQEKLSYDLAEGVATIRLNDPATLNAMSSGLAQALLEALRRGEREARAILLTSEGRAFSSGANLTDGAFDLNDPGRDVGGRLDGLFNPIIYQIRTSERPVVTAVRGAAAGVGCAIALAGDLIIAAESGYFLQAFRNVGLGPDGGSSYLLSRAIGRVRAMEMMLLGERVPAAQALQWGLINRVVPDDALDTVAADMARNLATGPRSLGLIKKLAWAALDASLETTLSLERVSQREAGRSDDFVEGVTAFREKRKPQFKGR